MVISCSSLILYWIQWSFLCVIQISFFSQFLFRTKIIFVRYKWQWKRWKNESTRTRTADNELNWHLIHVRKCDGISFRSLNFAQFILKMLIFYLKRFDDLTRSFYALFLNLMANLFVYAAATNSFQFIEHVYRTWHFCFQQYDILHILCAAISQLSVVNTRHLHILAKQKGGRHF